MSTPPALALAPNSFSFVELDWETADEHPRLFVDEIHLWWLPLRADEEQEKRYRHYLSDGSVFPVT